MRRALASRWALPGLAVLIFAVVALAVWLPWATKERPATTGTPTPPAFAEITPVVLPPGAEACETLVAFASDTRTATVLSAEQVLDGPPLRVVATAGDWSAEATVEGGYGGYSALTAALDPPPEDAIGELCVTNEGDRRVALQATTEGRIQTRSATEVDSEVVEPRMTLLLGQGEDRSLLDRPGQILERVAAFKPPIVGTWSLALLGLLTVLLVPAAVVFAVWRGIAGEDES